MPCIQVNNSKASALISIYAAQVLSFKPAQEMTDLLFVSDKAYFQSGKATKGGIPICWPWFGIPPEVTCRQRTEGPAHGFARNHLWSVSSTVILPNGETKIVLTLKDSEQTRSVWPFSFQLVLEIIIGDALALTLHTRNTGSEPFVITEALHTYFYVGDVTRTTVFGLEKTEYFNKKEGFVPMCQVGELTIEAETDQIHTDLRHQLIVDDPVLQRKIKISASGNKNVVVWNPGADIAAAMPDLQNEDYRSFICLEVANVAAEGIEILPNDEHRIQAVYSLV